MKILRLFFAIVGGLLLIPIVAVATVSVSSRGGDGPSGVFAGGELVAGELHASGEPDWSFTEQVFTIELQLVNPLRSRLIWVVESDGKIYISCGYMNSAVGRMWKHWAVEAQQDGRAVVRIAGKRYQRQLVRITSGDELDGVANALQSKYRSSTSRASIEAGDSWIFELAPLPSNQSGE